MSPAWFTGDHRVPKIVSCFVCLIVFFKPFSRTSKQCRTPRLLQPFLIHYCRSLFPCSLILIDLSLSRSLSQAPTCHSVHAFLRLHVCCVLCSAAGPDNQFCCWPDNASPRTAQAPDPAARPHHPPFIFKHLHYATL